MPEYGLSESEHRFAAIIWELEPIASGELVNLCAARLGWKKSTTYTVLKKLCDRGLFRNENAVVTSVVTKDLVQKQKSERFVQSFFKGSLPHFLNAFIAERSLSDAEVEELKEIIEKGRRK